MDQEKSSYTRAQFRQATRSVAQGEKLLAQAEGRLRSPAGGLRARLVPSPQIVAVALVVMVIVAVLAGWSQSKTPKSSASLPASSFSSSSASAPATSGAVLVDVVGKVNKPGVVRLDASARVQDAIKAAGGALAGTDLSELNLARKVSDGEQIRVGIDESAGSDSGGASAGENSEGEGAAAGSGGKISINDASKEQLEQLPGVGEALAQRIVAYRKEQGRFQNIEDLKNVSGIGEKKYAALAELIKV
ncbi:ComEA family DNA-binding protein [Varibaculum prostatecancerukia]|uniref:ComEA family DNA-binding protein n=1 Tax=Varibaculum prostatecancerukia TaxID=2811781 RepID=UPI001C002661|nr:ComEA family DNA-binding protein [Varibaculum prostatecancerukia]